MKMEGGENSKKKLWITIPAIFLILIILLTLFLPTFLSTESGKHIIIGMVEKKTGGNLEIGNLSLGWFSDQQIDKLHFSDQKGGQITLTTLTSGCPFWHIIMRRGTIGKTQIDSPKIIFSTKGPTKAPSEKIPRKKAKEEKSIWSDFKGHLVVTNGIVTVRNEMTIEDLYLDIHMTKSNVIKTLIINGKTRQNNILGSIDVKGKMERWFEGKANFTNLPVEGLDRIVSLLYPTYQGLLLESLGDSVNVQIESIAGRDQLNLNLSLLSPRLLVDLKPKYSENQFVLTQGGRIAWTIKPYVFNHFSKDAQLQNDAQGELRLDSAILPFKKKLEFPSLAAVGSFTFSNGNFLLKQINERVSIESLTTNFSTKNLKELLTLNISSSLKFQGGNSSGIRGTASIQNVLEKSRSFPAIDLNVDNLPLALVDSRNESSLAKYLGTTFSGKIQKSNDRFTVSGRTPLLQISDTVLMITDRAHLSTPSTFSYTVQPQLYESLTRPFVLNGTLKYLDVPLKDEALMFSEAAFELDIGSQAIELNDLFSLGRASLPTLSAAIKGTSLEMIHFNGNSQLNFGSGTMGESILGNTIGLTVDGTIKAKDEVELPRLNIALDGRKFKGNIEGAIEKNIFILKNALKGDFLLEPSQINPILSKDDKYPLLSKATPFHIEIKPSKIPLKGADLADLSLKGKGTIDSLSMINPTNRYPFDFQNVELDFDLDGKKSTHTVHFEGNALEENAKGGKLELTLIGKGKASELVSSPENIKASMSNFSSQIADVIFKTKGQLPDMIGATLNMKYEMERIGKNQNIDIYIKSPNLDLDGSFVTRQLLELRNPRKPLKIRWDVTEKGYDAFRRWRNTGEPLTSNNPLFEIDGTGSLKIQISPFTVPLKEKGKGFPKPDFNMYGSLFDVNVRINDIRLKEGRTGVITELKNFDFDIAKQSTGNTPLTFKFNGNVSPYKKGGNGKIQGSGKLQDFLSSTGALDLSNVTTSIHAQIKNLPSVFVDALSKFDASSNFPPSAFLGDLFNASFDAEVTKSQGKVTMDIDASACKALFDGIISDGILYLSQPLKTVFTITPQLNDVLDKSAKLVVVAMEKPITLLIHDKGFSVPLKNLHIRNMSFNYGQLDLGQIVCKNVGSAGEVGGLFKMDSSGNISLWFARSEFNMKRGKMYVDRTEILFNETYQVCLWGQVKFPKRYVDMTLGLTAGALSAALGIKGIDNDYVLKIPVEGPFGNVKIDTGAATGKIAFLVARKQIAPKAGIWGQVLGAVGDLADNQADVPPPKPPFPWQQ